MRYRFNEFEFDSDSLLLTNKGATQAIRHSEALVLSALLEHSNKVLSKEDILSQVWQHKIVSDQVVFQNISHLRNRFGSHVIKTFPKRGYQWQLAVEKVSTESQPHPNNENLSKFNGSSAENLLPGRTEKRPFWALFVLAGIFITVAGGIFSFNNLVLEEGENALVKLAYIPISIQGDNSKANGKYIKFNENSKFNFTELTHLTTEQFEDGAELVYPKLSSEHPYVLTGRFRTHQQQAYLDFTIKGPVSDWQGQLSGSSQQDITQQLLQHLSLQVIYDLISHFHPPEVRQAKLSIAHQASPNDLIILRELSVSYFMTNELEKSMAMTDKLIHLAREQNKRQQIGRAFAYQSKILISKSLYDLSFKKLKLAMEQFEKIDDLKYLAQAWYYQSWLDDQQQDYKALKSSLLYSVKIALEAQNKTGEIDTLIHLAGKAHYYQNDEDKYYYLQQAESQIKAYNLPSYHLAKISYRYATFAKAPSEKEPHLKEVLKLTELTPDHWVAQSSRRKLVQQYLEQARVDDAQALIHQVVSDNSQNSYLKTILAKAKLQNTEMINHAQRTFEQAQLAGERSLSLDVALILCSQQVNTEFYSQYISHYATERWRNTNETELIALNL